MVVAVQAQAEYVLYGGVGQGALISLRKVQRPVVVPLGIGGSFNAALKLYESI